MISLKIKRTSFFAYIAMLISFMSGYPVFYGEVGTFKWVFFYYGSVLGLFILALYYIFINKSIGITKERKFFIILFCAPRLIMLFYSIIIWMISNTAFPYISRGISNTIFQCLAYFCGVCFACGERDNILKVTLSAGLSVFGIAYILMFVRNGIGAIHGFNPLDPDSDKFIRYTELHELAYVMGLYILLSLVIKKQSSLNKRNFLFWLSIFAFVVAWKRIGILSLILVFIYYLIFNKSIKKDNSNFVKITGVVSVIICLVIVSVIISGLLTKLFNIYGIEMSGRDIIYDYFRKFANFSLFYLGKGVGFVSRQFDYTTRADLYNMVSVKALHNDLLKMYINIGFIGYVIWCIWWLLKLPQILMKKYDVRKSFICLLFILYSFILYTTDNAESYTNYQFHLAAIITYVSCFLRVEEGKK